MSCMALHTQKTIIIANGKKKKKRMMKLKVDHPCASFCLKGYTCFHFLCGLFLKEMAT